MGTCVSGASSRQDVVRHVMPAVVALYGGPSAATGFFISPQGHMVTSHHTVQKHPRIMALLADGRKLNTRVVGSDRDLDLAVLQVIPDKDGDTTFPYLEWESTVPVDLGDDVYTFGNHHGIGISASHGMCAAKDVPLQNAELNFNTSGRIRGFLQTDALISLGCSGGPIVNEKGRVVAVTTFILAPGQESIGLGFGTPAELIRDVVTSFLLQES